MPLVDDREADAARRRARGAATPRRRGRASRRRARRSSARASGRGSRPPAARAPGRGSARRARPSRSGRRRAAASRAACGPRGRRRTGTRPPRRSRASAAPGPRGARRARSRPSGRSSGRDADRSRRGVDARRGGERLQHLDRRREDDRRRLRRAELEQRLQVAQLQRDRVRLDHERRVLQPLGGLELALGVDHLRAPLALGLRLARHRALHALRDLDVLDLDDRDLDAPGRGLLVDDPLQDRVDLLALRQQLVELVLAEHRAQRRLRDLRRRDHEVLDLHDRVLRARRSGSTRRRSRAPGTLSFVITSCGGMLSVIVRRSTRDHPVDDRDQDEEARALRLAAAAGRAGRRSRARTRARP